jgi:hypothetical protein
MPSSSRAVGRESCGGGIPRVGLEDRCFTRSASSAWPRRWVADPASLTAKADSLGVAITAVLCIGCNRKLARLQAEGRWPA